MCVDLLALCDFFFRQFSYDKKLAKGSFQKRFSGFFPPPPLTENHFSKKPLAERGGPPPPLTESPLSFSGIFFAKRTKNDVFGFNNVKNGPKRAKNV